MISDNGCYYCMVSVAGPIPMKAHTTSAKHREKIISSS